jgi:UDP-N-acetylglucosamine acyltransferase
MHFSHDPSLTDRFGTETNNDPRGAYNRVRTPSTFEYRAQILCLWGRQEMNKEIHASAVIDPSAKLGVGVAVGPNAVIGADVTLGDGTHVGASAQVYGPSRIGKENRIFPHSCVGFEPQDLKFGGGETRLEVGDGNRFREFSTVHRGTEEGGGVTTIGDENLFMVYTHVAHDCHVGSRTVFSNAATLAGHVVVDDDSTIGAFSAVHQFCRVGRHAYIGGYSVITKDALPWVKSVGIKPACYGVNKIGLERKSLDGDSIKLISAAMRLLLRSNLNTTQAIERMTEELGESEEITYLIEFLNSSQRGVLTALPGRRGARGG